MGGKGERTREGMRKEERKVKGLEMGIGFGKKIEMEKGREKEMEEEREL